MPRPEHSEGCSPRRLNLLLSHADWRQDDSPVHHLAQLLAPMGIQSFEVASGEEAADVIRAYPIHIAVVDLGIPLQRSPQACNDVAFVTVSNVAPTPETPGGPRILQLLRRLDQPPPTVVVRPPQPTHRESVRTLSDALREGAFAVLDRPLQLESLLEVMRRILRRHYANHWPC